MKKVKKTLYLNKTIVIVSMIGYSAFLILMLLMDWYMIRDYQYERKNAKKSVLDKYVDTTKDSMEKIDQLLYDIYANNENFRALQKEEESVFEYGHAYELRETLTKRMILEEDLSGFFIFYGNRQKSWYGFNTKYADIIYSRAVKEILLKRLEESERMRKWSVVDVDGELSLAMYYEKARVAVFGVYLLRNTQQMICESAGTQVQVSMIQDGKALTNKELAEKLGLTDSIGEALDSFDYSKGPYQVFGRRIPNTELWVCTVYRLGFWDAMTLQQLMLLVVTGLSILAVMFLFGFMKNQVVRPLRQLTNTMNEIRSGKSREVPELGSRFQEFTDVGRTLGKMVHELEEQKLLTYEEIIEKQKAQMQYLQL